MIDITWHEFKNEASKNTENYKNIAYRGHASPKWQLECTLRRYLLEKKMEKRSIRSSEYIDIVKQIAIKNKIEE